MHHPRRTRIIILAVAILLAFASVGADVSYAGGMEYKATPLDNMWDWATTLGKDGVEKQQILAQNKAERLKRHAEKMAKKAQKNAEKAGADMKKKFGM